MAVESVILAAGQGTRMKSARPKVLQSLGGRSLLAHVLDNQARPVSQQIHVVVGHGGDQVRAAFAQEPALHWVDQAEQLGTGHALAQALPAIDDEAVVLVLYGDVPLVNPADLQALCECAADGQLAVLTVLAADPSGYGRILRRDEAVVGIVEHKDASAAQLAIDEINTGLLAAPAARLKHWVAQLGNDNSQGEYYLTDCVALAAAQGVPIRAIRAAAELEVAGVNDRRQLAALERALQSRQAAGLMRDGLQLLDPARFDLRGELTFGRDCCIDVNAVLEGRVELGDEVSIGAHCLLRNVRIANGCRIEAHSVLDGAELGPGCQVGPFARLRPGTRLAGGAKVGNFVEIKNTQVGQGSKISHLSYVGDAQIGVDVNIGAGTITCNYDGVNKHLTRIDDGAFIGSNTALVAPVTVGANATIGAGSVITKPAPPGKLSLTRARQSCVDAWRRPSKKES